ncbi:MAG: hypothetical protein R3E55_04800 [Burkholderiaceae bacterium]
MSHLVEKLDATVLGLVEALDADSEDLPRLLDEALQGSLWARQIGKEDEDERQAHKAILEARANVIWSHTTPDARKGHYAMGVGLEAGLAIDGMADVLGDLLDQADEAALRDDGAALSRPLRNWRRGCSSSVLSFQTRRTRFRQTGLRSWRDGCRARAWMSSAPRNAHH